MVIVNMGVSNHNSLERLTLIVLVAFHCERSTRKNVLRKKIMLAFDNYHIDLVFSISYQ